MFVLKISNVFLVLQMYFLTLKLLSQKPEIMFYRLQIYFYAVQRFFKFVVAMDIVKFIYGRIRGYFPLSKFDYVSGCLNQHRYMLARKNKQSPCQLDITDSLFNLNDDKSLNFHKIMQVVFLFCFGFFCFCFFRKASFPLLSQCFISSFCVYFFSKYRKLYKGKGR